MIKLCELGVDLRGRDCDENNNGGLRPYLSREVTRKLQRKLYAKAKQETAYRYASEGWVHRRDILSRAGKRRTEKCACLGMKNIGKPCAGSGVGRAFAKQKLAKPHARFDEGGQVRACSLLYPLFPFTCNSPDTPDARAA